MLQGPHSNRDQQRMNISCFLIILVLINPGKLTDNSDRIFWYWQAHNYIFNNCELVKGELDQLKWSFILRIFPLSFLATGILRWQGGWHVRGWQSSSRSDSSGWGWRYYLVVWYWELQTTSNVQTESYCQPQLQEKSRRSLLWEKCQFQL